MGNPLDTERIQFFLRHHDDIKEWAAIEREVSLATREMLGGLLDVIDARVKSVDAGAEVVRHDGGRYERILIRRPEWPIGVGVALEWDQNIDPFGSSVPKYGLFVLPREGGWVAAHQAIDAEARSSAELRALGHKPGDGTWPVNQYVPKSAGWWRDLDGWTTPFVERLLSTWSMGAPILARGLLLGA